MKFSFVHSILFLFLACWSGVSAFSPVKSVPGAGVTFSTSLDASPNPLVVTAAKGMSLLSPVFKAEAALQAKLLGGPDVMAEAEAELNLAKKKNKVLIYTYGLSPFSSEAVSILKDSGYEYTQIELGKEWFLLGGKGSALRQIMGSEVESGATSLPKIFIGGKCIGGCAELSNLVKSGELGPLMKSARVPMRKN